MVLCIYVSEKVSSYKLSCHQKRYKHKRKTIRLFYSTKRAPAILLENLGSFAKVSVPLVKFIGERDGEVIVKMLVVVLFMCRYLHHCIC